jgi:hypothetical protein
MQHATPVVVDAEEEEREDTGMTPQQMPTCWATMTPFSYLVFLQLPLTASVPVGQTGPPFAPRKIQSTGFCTAPPPGHSVKTHSSLPERDEPEREEEELEPVLQQPPQLFPPEALQYSNVSCTPLLQSKVPPAAKQAASDIHCVPAGQPTPLDEEEEREELLFELEEEEQRLGW